MKKILMILVMMVLVVGCAKKDEYSLGTYKDRTYTNNDFNMKFDILEDFAFLTSDELKQLNDQSHEQAKDPELAKFFNKVVELSNTDKVTLVIYVDSTPESYKNADAEANGYLDFLSEQRVAYSLEKDDVTLNGLEFKRLKLEFDFDQRQVSMYTVKDDRLMNIQITYPKGHDQAVEVLMDMLNSNE